MEIIERIRAYAIEKPDLLAMVSDQETISYGDLDLASDYLAYYIDSRCRNNKNSIAIYGHKSIYMLVSMIACVKSGRAYCPIDISLPEVRIQAILDKMESPIILDTEKLNCRFPNIVTRDNILEIIKRRECKINLNRCVTGDDLFYIIFTSGSSGEPKGVEITNDCLNNFLEWSVTLGNSEAEKKEKVFLNQAPFSFDLSVMDVFTCLASGGTIWALTKETQNSYNLMMNSLRKSNVAIWVSTPSFAEVCLAEKQFDENMMSSLEYFVFCGETLTNATVEKLYNRFPKAKIINTYGPTETTVAVTSIEITKEICKEYSPLPVGIVKPGCHVEIVDSNGNVLPENMKGEIVINGNTVGKGYYKMPHKTDEVFISRQDKFTRGYKTSDEGYLSNGVLYYSGRLDFQIKLHGYRIEIQDIESNFLKLEHVEQCVVIPNMKDGKVRSLSAYIMYSEKIINESEVILHIKDDLKKLLPDYMIPKKIIFVDKLPRNNNGKIERKALGGALK